jgi:hypothetical protein
MRFATQFLFTALPQLAAPLQRQREHTSQMERRLGQVIPHVFHRNGKPIKSYNGAWRSACKWAAIVKRDGLETVIRPRLLGRIPHDWKTDSMFRRYAIVDDRDLRTAVELLARWTTGGQSPIKAVRMGGSRGA